MVVSVAVGLGLYWLVMLVVSGNFGWYGRLRYNASKVLDHCFCLHHNNWVAESIRTVGSLIHIDCCLSYYSLVFAVVVSYCCHSCLSLGLMMLLLLMENFGFDYWRCIVVVAVSAVAGGSCDFGADFVGFELEWLLLVF